MLESFNSYAKYYDLLYSDKDYEGECVFIESIFRNYAHTPPEEILDAGCGTGGHALPLARRGYRVTGLDASESMIAQAEMKAHNAGVSVQFHKADLRDFDLSKNFDACVCMFAVIDYVTETQDLLKTFKNIACHLVANGLFVFDFWYGPAVLKIRPSVRVKTVKNKKLQLIRTAKPTLDVLRHLCAVDYHLIVLEGSRVVDEVRERHLIRYLFPEELRHYLEESGFNLLELTAFLDLTKAPTEDNWNVTAIAMKA